jgi:hypothetical protein
MRAHILGVWMITAVSVGCSPTSSPAPSDAGSGDGGPSANDSGLPANDSGTGSPDGGSSLINSCRAYYDLNPDKVPAASVAFCLENTTTHQPGNCCVSDNQCADMKGKCCPWGQDGGCGSAESCECYLP